MSRKRKQLNKKTRIKIWEEANKKCQYCGIELEYKDMQVDHIEPVYLGGDCNLENYRASCRPCNYYKDTFSVEKFREQLSKLPDRMLRDVFIFKLTLRHGIIKINKEPIVFEFEKNGGKEQ